MTLFADLVATSNRIAASASRLAKVRALAERLRAIDADDIVTATHYLSGTLPQGRIGLGYAQIEAAGAAGAVESTLSIGDVDRAIDEIAGIRGSGTAERRGAVLADLFARATSAERDFVARLLIGELRHGALAGVMADAIAEAAELPPGPVRRALMYASSIGAVARAAIVEGEAGLARFGLELLSPVAPMLARTAADVDEALAVLGDEAAFDYKVDGARIQVHKSGDEVRIYTRALNEIGDRVPEIVEAVRALDADRIVLDGEAVALDARGRPHPFQTTMRRFGRRLDIAALRAELPMHAYFFDCLLLGNERLADRSARERFEILARIVPAPLAIPRLVSGDVGEARAFYRAALAAGHEGVVAKSLDAAYEAGNRGAGWLKIKRAHTLDLVVLAGEWGHGRRSGKLSNLHLGALDPASGDYVMLGKTFKGLTDAMLAWQTEALLAREIRRDRHTVFVRPELVVEIAFSDLQASPRYPGGIALRLARVKRYRDDKSADEADTMNEVRALFAAQGAAQPVSGPRAPLPR